MKHCSTCKHDKSIELFSKNKSNRDGYSYHCKQCALANNAKWAKNNPEKFKEVYAKQNASWKKNNPEKVKKCAKNWQQKNLDKHSSYNSKWKKANPGKWNAIAARYRAAKLNATPSWLTDQHWAEIEEFYVLAQELAWLNNGEIFEVDHIMPLQGENSSGLHVPWNLQLLPKSANSSKGNR